MSNINKHPPVGESPGGKNKSVLIKKPWPMAKRFLTIFLPLAILVGITTAGIYAVDFRRKMDLITNDEVNFVQLLKQIISVDLELVVADLMILSESPNLQAILASGGDQQYEALTQEFLSFAGRKTIYDQIRLLDETGQEIVRINFNDGKLDVVPQDQLQFKGDRYYFQDIYLLEQGRVFVSPLDLNIEHGEIEQPLKPMIRFGTPVFDTKGQKRGIVILNYFGDKLIGHLEGAAPNALGQISFLNAEGFWLKGPEAENEWGFMYSDRSDQTFGNANPEAWSQISGTERGQFQNSAGLFTFSTVYPLIEAWESSTGSGKAFEPSAAPLGASEYYWKIVLQIFPDTLNANTRGILGGLLWLNAFLLVVVASGSWMVAQARENRKLAEYALRESEARLRTIIESEPECVMLLAEDGTVLQMNPAGLAMFEADSLDEVEGKSVYPLITPEFRSAFEAFMAKVFHLEGGAMEFEIVGLKGNRRWLESHAVPLLDDNGEVTSLLAATRDNTERKKLEIALSSERDKFNFILQELPVGVAVLDSEDKYVYINPATIKIDGYQTDQDALIGKDVRENHPKHTLANLDKLLINFKTSEMSFYSREAKRGKRTVEISYHASRDLKGEYQGLVRVVSDVTDRMRGELALRKERDRVQKYSDALERSNEELEQRVSRRTVNLEAAIKKLDDSRLAALNMMDDAEQARRVAEKAENEIRTLNVELEQRVLDRTAELEATNKELESFSYSVSHDLRAPLRAMDGYARILNTDFSTQLPEEGQRYMRKVQESAKRMGVLIDDMLAFSRLTRTDIKVQNVQPKPIVDQVLNDLQVELVDRDLEFIIGELCECQSDPVMLRQVFVNLLHNAIKFTRGRDPALIEVGCRPENKGEGVCLYFVKDNGVGFDMRYVDKLFGVFQRLHRAEEYEGTGVGLAIVQRIIHRHGGEIWAESQVDKGSTFFFTLPRPSDRELSVDLEDAPIGDIPGEANRPEDES
jgi:PAS domain S-box-containing protein